MIAETLGDRPAPDAAAGPFKRQHSMSRRPDQASRASGQRSRPALCSDFWPAVCGSMLHRASALAGSRPESTRGTSLPAGARDHCWQTRRLMHVIRKKMPGRPVPLRTGRFAASCEEEDGQPGQCRSQPGWPLPLACASSARAIRELGVVRHVRPPSRVAVAGNPGDPTTVTRETAVSKLL